MALYNVAIGGLPQASDLNQLIDIFNGAHDIGTLSLAPVVSVPATTGFALTAQAGTTLGVGAYNYQFTYVTGYYKSDGTLVFTGETPASPALAITTATGSTTVKVTLPVPAATSVVATRIYRTAVGGSTYGLIATVKDGTLVYTDSTADASRGAVPPGTNTTGTDLQMNNQAINGISYLYGQYGTIAHSRVDDWLGLNDDGSHVAGVYFGSSIVRTDGQLQVGTSGAKFLVDASGNMTFAGSITNAGKGNTGANQIERNSTNPAFYANQLGTGNIADFQLAGTTKASVSNGGVFVSTVATGTAPFTVASTTKVANLNADQLDGLDSASFIRSDAADSFSGQLTSTLATGTAPFVIASTTKVTNLNADMVDGYSFNQDVQTTASPTFAGLSLGVGTLSFGTNNIRNGGTGATALILGASGGSVFLRPNGDSSSTGEVTVNPGGVITSNVVNGTAPFVVASTTAVTNLNADMVDGLHVAQSSGTGANILGTIPRIGTDGVTELAKYLDFHDQSAATQTDYDVRFTVTGSGTSNAGTLAIGSTMVSNTGSMQASAFTSTVATGTAPFTVTSTTKVTNLNADLLDGLDATSFIRSDAADSFSGQLTSTLATGTAPFVVASSTAVTNLNADLLDGFHASDFQRADGTTSYSTASTGGTANGQYTKVATINVTAQYGYVNTSLLFMAGADGASTLRKAIVDIRVKQQNAMASAPYYELDLVEATGGVVAGDFVAVISANTATATTVDLYFRISNQYEQYSFVSLVKNASSSTLTLVSNQAFVATLPTGTQITCTDITKAKKTGDTFTGAVTATAFTSNIATGTAPFTVTSTTKVTNLNADLLDGYDTSTTAVASKIPVYNASAQLVGDITGNAATATKLQTARTIATSGDATGTATSFDGTANITIPLTLAASGVTAGTYKSVTVDAKGRVTGGTNPTTLAGYGITDAASTSGATFTGNVTAPAFVSNVVTGTAPFTVTSTTAVTNLNADKVDGYDFNQGVQTTDSPAFAGLSVNAAPTITKTSGQMLTFKQTDYVTAGGMYQYIGFGDDTGAWKSYVGFSSSRDNALTLYNSLGDVHITPKTGSNTHITGTADATGNITAPAFVSNVAVGTAPFTVTSTTKVPNLNADTVDGYNLNQDVQTTASPTFAGLSVSGNITATGTASSIGVEAWTTATLLNSWTVYSSLTVGYYKTPFGEVRLKGYITGGTKTSGTTLFTLPVGYRPTQIVYISTTVGSIPIQLAINTLGNVSLNADYTGTYISLDGLTFRNA
jgi:hypothetical protein